MRNGIRATLKMSLVALLALALVAFISSCGGSSGGSDATKADNGEVEEHVDDEHVDDEHADDEHADDEHADGDEHSEDTVHVALDEWSILPAHGDALQAEAGHVVFEIHNEGAAPHDFKIIKTDLSVDALPIADGVVDMEAAGEVIGGADPLPGDIMVEESYDLEPGKYVAICTIPGHYQQGMFAELTVH